MKSIFLCDPSEPYMSSKSGNIKVNNKLYSAYLVRYARLTSTAVTSVLVMFCQASWTSLA